MKKMSGNLIIITTLIAIFLIQCNQQQAGPVTLGISWWGDDSRHNATLEAISQFEKLNPMIKIEPVYGGWQGHLDTITQFIKQNRAPDIMQVNWNWLTIFSKDGNGFYDLRRVKKEIGLENWSDNILVYTTINNRINGIPVSISGREFYWNKTTFDKFGVSIPKTWEELFRLSEKFPKGYYPLDLSERDAWTLANVWVEQKTGKQFITDQGHVGYTVDDIQEALRFYKELQDKKITQGIAIRNANGGKTNYEVHGRPEWLSGKWAGTYIWESAVLKVANPLKDSGQELVLGHLPVLPNAESKGYAVKPSMLFAINKSTKYPKQAAQFINYILNDPKGVAILGLTRGIPSSKSAQETLAGQGILSGFQYNGLLQVLANQGKGFGPFFENPEILNLYSKAIEDISIGQGSIEVIAKTLYDSVSVALQRVVQ